MLSLSKHGAGFFNGLLRPRDSFRRNLQEANNWGSRR